MSRLIRMVVVGVLLAGGLTLVATSSASASTLQSGVVTTGDGTPLEGATVAVFDETGKGIAETTTTAADGTYTLNDCPSCLGQVVAAAQGYYSARGGPNYTLFANTNPYVGQAGMSTLNFAWTAVPGAVAYRLTFADERTFKHPKIIVRATRTVHAYTGLLQNHLYYFVAYPIDADSHVIRPDIWLGDSNRPLAGRTGYVNNLHVTGRTSSSVAFAWSPVRFAACCALYQVQLSSSPKFDTYRSTPWQTGDTFVFTNLKPGTAYYARARALNARHTYGTPWSGTKFSSTL